ncbi:hypothetical protein C0989_004713 [Termitomyces sp. Mn162]|nr:hypothetical protein C0989_004713 [Termitomyces sp. Mn162]
MATAAEALPTLSAQGDPKQKESYNDEKRDSVEIAESIKGDVYDDLRVIDLGEDGKERPIGILTLVSAYSPSSVRNRAPEPDVASRSRLGSQLMGYGLGGIMRSFLVYPTYIVFPNLLPTVQLFDALHRGKKIMLQKKRVKFFWLVFIGIFVWEWFPEYIAP